MNLRFQTVKIGRTLIALAILSSAANPPSLFAQATVASGSTDSQRLTDIERRLDGVTTALKSTQESLDASLREVQRLQGELKGLRAKSEAEAPKDAVPATAGANQTRDLASVRDEQEALQAEIKQHEQIKVETASKYPLRVTGLVLFNAFANAGVVDDASLPTYAFPSTAASTQGSTGATMRQTLLGFDANGPKLGGARSSAAVTLDFFGSVSANTYGYNSPAGTVRMRQALVSLDWSATTVEAGYTSPLISPLSPTSYATVAQPALSGSGNLWVWSPQVWVGRRVPISASRTLGFEAGLIYPQSPGYSSGQLISAVEASRRPGVEGRVSYGGEQASKVTDGPFTVGLGAYYSEQRYSSSTEVRAWAVTADWRFKLTHRLRWSGEAYRGNAIGGLGGGAYNDVLVGMDTVSGLSRTKGVEAVGGWSQLRLHFTPCLEANGMFGIDDPMASNFYGVTLYPSSNPTQTYTRNIAVAGNFIYRPKTYLILSPEFRRIVSSRHAMSSNSANLFTITAGYQF